MSERRNSIVSSRRSSVQVDPKDGQGMILQTGPSSQDDVESGTYSSIRMAKPLNVAGIAAFRRFSRRTSVAGFGRPILKTKPKLENTFKMEPDSNVRFNTVRVERMLDDILCSSLDGKQYDATTAATLVATIADTIKRQTKLMGFDRHKLVTHVVVGNIYDQGASITSRCLWDSKNDNFASAYYRNASLYAVATVYAIYFE